jgi:hypothetical protein
MLKNGEKGKTEAFARIYGPFEISGELETHGRRLDVQKPALFHGNGSDG